MKTKKKFDCVGFKRQAQEKIYEDTKGMTATEEIAYYRNKAQSSVFAHLWKGSRRKSAALSEKRLP
jgi:hypothetical protein